MLSLAIHGLRARRGAFSSAFIALFCAAAIVSACGILLQSAQRAGVPTERYAAAAAVVGGDQTATSTHVDAGGTSVYTAPLRERVRIPADLAGRIATVPGVRAAVGDVSFPAAVIGADGKPAAGPGGGPIHGHGWSSAALAPFALRDGRAPERADEIVLDGTLANRAAAGVGDTVRVQAPETSTALVTYQVVGVAVLDRGPGVHQQAALFFSDERAGALAGRPGRVDAIGVLAHPGTDVAQLTALLEQAVAGTGARVWTGKDRGTAEFLDVDAAYDDVTALAGVFGSYALFIAAVVVAGTFALSVQQRTRELALLRAVGATPWQIRRSVAVQAFLVALAAALPGSAGGIGVAAWMLSGMADRGLAPQTLSISIGPAPLLVAATATVVSAVTAASITAWRPSRIRPTQALGEAAVQRRSIGIVRALAGLAALSGGAVLLSRALNSRGDAATEAAGPLILVLIVAVALLSPLIAVATTALLGLAVRVLSPSSGYLAAANSRADAHRLGAAITPLILATGFTGTVLFAQSTLQHAAELQLARGTLADHVAGSSGPGLPTDVAVEARRLPGVAAATAVKATHFVKTRWDPATPTLSESPALGITVEGIEQTLDPEVTAGDLGELHGDTVAVSTNRAETMGLRVGANVDVLLGDGTPKTLRVVATYDRDLGFGDFLVPHDLAVEHATERLDDNVLVRGERGADASAVADALEGLAARHPGLLVGDRAGYDAQRRQQQALNDWITHLLVGLVGGYTGIAVITTLAMAMTARSREFALLRLVGATRGQVLRMAGWEAAIIAAAGVAVGSLIALASLAGLAAGSTGSWVPHVPPLAGAAVALGAAALGMAATLLPTRLVLNSVASEEIGTPE